MVKSFEVKLVKSTISCTQSQRATVRAMGLRKLNSSVKLADNSANRGQIMKVQHLVEVKVLR